MYIKKYFYKSSSEVQELIDSKGYQNRRQMKDEFPGLYYKCYDENWMKDLIFPDDIVNKRWKDMNSLEDFQKFIDENPNIKSSEDLRKEYPGLYNRSRSHDILSKIKFKRPNKKLISWEFIDSFEDFENFIEDNDVSQRVELLERFPGLYGKSVKRGWLKEASFEKDRHRWQDMSIEEIQKFIDSNPDLINMESLYIHGFSGLKSYLRKNKLVDKISFKYRGKSSWEIKLSKALKKAGIETRVDTDTSYSNWSRLDLMVEGHKIAIEIQGPYHWKEHNPRNFIRVRKSDIKKHRWSINNNITLFYFTYGDYLKFGYPYYVYTSEKELIADILKEISNQTNNTSNGNES